MSTKSVQRIGLTGGIACGKSTVEKILLEAGWPVLDTDQVAHRVLEPDSPVYEAVIEEFGSEVVKDDGRIDRRKLGALVFADASRRIALNALVHPEIETRWKEWLSTQTATAARAVVSIPLLYEVGLENNFDHIVCVAAPAQRVMEHLKQRGLSEEAARMRVDAQWPVDLKAAQADAVIRNDGSLELLKKRVNEWMASISHQE